MFRAPLADQPMLAASQPANDPLAGYPPGGAELTELRLLRASQQAIDQIGSGVELDIVLHDLAALVSVAAAPARCAIAARLGEDGPLRVLAAPGTAQDTWPAQEAGVAAALQKLSTVEDGDEAQILQLEESGTESSVRQVWCRAIHDGNGAPIAAIALIGGQTPEPTRAAIAAVRTLVPVVKIAIERRRYAGQLRAAANRFAALAASVPGVVYQRLVSPQGKVRYTYVSEGARDLYGVAPEEILADPNALFRCHAASYREGFRDRLLEASRSLTMWDVELEIQSRDGKRKWTHARARPTRLADGTVQWDGVILDATRIAARESELRQQKEAAESASRGMSEFISNMSHELRTPLNAIIGFSELMHAETLGPLGSERYASYCHDILESGRHLLNIVNDVLDVTKIESGKMSLNEEPIDLATVVEQVIEQLYTRAAAGAVRVSSALPESLPYLYADARLIKQTLLNLVSNAIKFTRPGGSVVVAVEDGEDGIALRVKDTGIGMKADDIPKAMQRFSQIDGSLSRRHEGTGLGLYLVKLFAELHQASIALESEVDLGTTVTVRFPPMRRQAG